MVDGAHNPDGMNGFLRSVNTYFETEDKVAVMGVFADKDYHAMAKMIGHTFSQIYTVTPPSERALAAEELASVLNACALNEAAKAEKAADRAVACGMLSEAFDLAKQHRDAVIFIFGSLSFLKGAYDYWD